VFVISVVVPAHNEDRVIGRLLEGIARGAEASELEVIVVCNGCSDATAETARRFGPAVVVMELEEASKIKALNAGDRAARSFPRFYVDADVSLSIEAIREVARVLEEGAVLAAAPRFAVDLAASSVWVRAFYSVWTQLPYHQSDLIGSGVYALSESGRARFSEFPHLISDDGFVRLLFRPEERRCVESCSFTIFAPMRLSGLIAIKTRARLGTLELRRAYPEMSGNEPRGYPRSMLKLLVRPTHWPALGVYLIVVVATRVRAWWRFRRADLAEWDRDEGSRSKRMEAPPHRDSSGQ
jgi:glycosyltransferase involved in cell wall biosynthesis